MRMAGLCPAIRLDTLLDNARHHAGADRAAALANGEAKFLFHGDRHDQVHFHRHVVARHYHFRALRQVHHTRHVGGAEIELRTIVGEKRSMTAALLLGEDVGFRFELRVRLDRAGLAEHLAALHFLALGATKQATDVVARLTLIQQLAEHLHAGDHGLGRWLDANDLDFLANLDDAALNSARADSAATGNGEHVFYRHQKWLVFRPLGLRNVLIHRLH